MIPLTLMILAAVILFAVAFIAPRWSRKPQGKVDRALDSAQKHASQAPGKAGELMPKPFQESEKVADKSAETGRKDRDKV